jgi:NCAIR mutase (PurE)-related protein
MALTLPHACGHRQLGHVQGVTAGCDGALPFVFACLLSVPGWMP